MKIFKAFLSNGHATASWAAWNNFVLTNFFNRETATNLRSRYSEKHSRFFTDLGYYNHFGAVAGKSFFSEHKQWHQYCFGLHLIWNCVFEPFQMDLWWKSQSKKCQPRSRFQNPDCQKKPSILFSNFDYNDNQYKQITGNVFVSDQIQWLCIGVLLVLFWLRFSALKWINGGKMKYENRKLQSKVDV